MVPRTKYVPDTAVTDTWVVLAHGFSRTEGAVEGLARHLASWGVPVVTTTSCHATPLDNDPQQDAADLVALADWVAAPSRLFVGHSAGGLRSVLAGAADPDAVGVLGLDLVDVFRLAETAAPTVTVPFAGVAGEPYDCNSEGNGDDVFAAAPGSTLLHVTDADHCDFEWPTDVLCTALCSEPGEVPPEEVRAVIHGLATAWVLWRAGAEPGGEESWVPGGRVYDALVASGAVR
jgi:pimeloyl-ACP methyl ester carboxylesterase